MTTKVYWENRGDIFAGFIDRARANKLITEAELNRHSQLVGDLYCGFSYFAAYHPTCGPMVRVIVTPVPTAQVPANGDPRWYPYGSRR